MKWRKVKNNSALSKSKWLPLTAANSSSSLETYAWTMYHAKPYKNVSEMDYGSKESWNIARDQENKSFQILWLNLEMFWLKNAQLHDLTSLNTLASDCLNYSHFPA